MFMDNTLELLGITDPNIKITRFSTESVNGEKRNVIEARLTYNVDRCPYCESEKVVRNGSKILHTRLTELHQERFEMKLYKQRYLCKECLKTWSARTDIVEEGHTLSHQLKRSVLHMAREGITATGIARICHCSPSSVIRIIDEAVELKSRVSRLPENLCFDELRSVNSTMSFICCDAEGSHDIVAILENRLTKTLHEPLHEPGKSCGEIRSCRLECPVHQVHQGIVSECPDHHRPLPHRTAGRKSADQKLTLEVFLRQPL